MINVYESLIGNYEVDKNALEKRLRKGIETYGTPLMTNNGRDAANDLIEELLDAIMYAHQLELEHPEYKGITQMAIDSYDIFMFIHTEK